VPSPSAANPAASKPKGGRIWIWLVAACVVLGAAGGGWWWGQSRAAADPADPAEKTINAPSRAPAQYFALEPTFVVNLADEEIVRYLQADLQLVTRDDATLAAFEVHAPLIRNRLLLLFGQQSAEVLARRSGKERLQDAARAEIRDLLKGEGAPNKVEAVIFTSLVTQ